MLKCFSWLSLSLSDSLHLKIVLITCTLCILPAQDALMGIIGRDVLCTLWVAGVTISKLNKGFLTLLHCSSEYAFRRVGYHSAPHVPLEFALPKASESGVLDCIDS